MKAGTVWNTGDVENATASVEEPPLFWAAPAPASEAQGPGADSGSDRIVSAPAPAPDKKGRLQAAPTPAPDTKICNFKL